MLPVLPILAFRFWLGLGNGGAVIVLHRAVAVVGGEPAGGLRFQSVSPTCHGGVNVFRAAWSKRRMLELKCECKET
jgi:hypothetical protein